VTLELAQTVLSPVQERCDTDHHSVDVQLIVKGLSKFYPYGLKDLRSKSRGKEIVRARQIVMYLLQKLSDMSLREIGIFLGGKNHATVKHAIAKIERMQKVNQEFANHITHIKRDIITLS